MSNWTIDTQHTQVEFVVRHMMISKVRGQFKSFEGNISINPDDITQSSAVGSIDVASIDTREADRDAHLRSADFFDVENYPKMTFESTRIEPQGGDRYKVTGNLTIKDVTREIVFDVTDEGRGQDPWGNQRQGLSASAKINRKDFGLTWNVALETGGWLVGDQITINAEVQLIYQPQAEAVPA
ncbi:MAG: YceI family protein [Anaerolineae bacterium]